MKVVFEFNVDNTIDIITNSSSELFVLKGKTRELVEEMIRNLYPDFEKEYRFLSISDCASGIGNEGDLDTYIDCVEEDNSDEFSLCKKLNVRPSKLYKNFGSYGLPYWYSEYSDEGKKLILEYLPKNIYLLFSLDENPNWKMQEKLSTIASRHHLG